MSLGAETIILGAGPGGSTLAGLLAADGVPVMLVDRSPAATFKVGESLLPEGVALCKRLGVDLDGAGFLRKCGAHFHLTEEDDHDRFDFREAIRGERAPHAYEVKRIEFDGILQRFAEDAGARIVRSFDVDGIDLDAGDGVEVVARDGRRLRARFLVDATGPAGLLGVRLGLREPIPGLRKAALFSHFSGVPRASGRAAGDIDVLHSNDGWHWIIPFSDGTASVGVVGEPEYLRSMGEDDQQRFDRLCVRSDTHRRLLGSRQQLLPLHRRADFSFRCRTFSGERFLLLGDAACFIDPVFSSGVFLAQKAAFVVHECVGPALRAGGLPTAEDRMRYESDMRVGLKRFLSLVRQFYDQAFVHNIIKCRQRPALKSALTSLLAGDVWDDDNVWIRMGVI